MSKTVVPPEAWQAGYIEGRAEAIQDYEKKLDAAEAENRRLRERIADLEKASADDVCEHGFVAMYDCVECSAAFTGVAGEDGDEG